jgi:hypothetical protein
MHEYPVPADFQASELESSSFQGFSSVKDHIGVAYAEIVGG